MSARPWRVEANLPLQHGGSDRWGWVNTLGSQEAALAEVERARNGWLRSRHWQYRIINRDTAEVVNVGSDDRPLPGAQEAS